MRNHLIAASMLFLFGCSSLAQQNHVQHMESTRVNVSEFASVPGTIRSVDDGGTASASFTMMQSDRYMLESSPTVTARRQEIGGVVVSGAVDPDSIRDGLNGTVNAEAVLWRHGGALKPGDKVLLRISRAAWQEIRVPLSVVYVIDGKEFVDLDKGNGIVRQRVSIYRTDGNYAAVRNLEPGMRIVIR